jgi:integrase
MIDLDRGGIRAVATMYRTGDRKSWIIEWTDENGKRHRRSGTTDKSVAKQIKADIEGREALRKQGLIDPAAERFAECGRRPIADHLDEFIASMEARDRDPKHVQSTRTYIRRVIDQAGAVRLADLTLSAVELAIGRIQKAGKRSARSANAYTIAVKAFMRWAVKDNRIRAHELGAVSRQNEDADRRYVRRPLTDDELRTLIAATRTAPEWRGIGGVDRSVFYLLGAATGFRRSELGSLRPEDFDLAGKMPVVRIDGSRTKNGRGADQPLLLDLAGELKPWLAGKAPGSPVFALPKKTGLMLHADLRRCGIEPVDGQGRVVDCHSLRHGYITALARARVPLKVAVELSRLRDAKLILRIYAHVSAHDLHGAVADALPDLTTPTAATSAMAATGTYNHVGHSEYDRDDPLDHPSPGERIDGKPYGSGPCVKPSADLVSAAGGAGGDRAAHDGGPELPVLLRCARRSRS